MKIVSAEVRATVLKPADFPTDGRPELALVGRSNVGKSSLINALVGRRNLARTSSTPGKTRTINFYLINQAFYLVDLPGYGFARVSQAERELWRHRIQDYLEKRSQLVGVIQLIDFRHPPEESDRTMAEWLASRGLPWVVVATKVDKVGRSRWNQHLSAIKAGLQLPPDTQPILFSAATGYGKDYLLDIVAFLMGQE